MIDQQSRILIDLAAQVDGLFIPIRHNRTPNSAAAAIVERRAQYHRAGLRITGGGSDQARQQHHNTLRALRDAGLVELSGATNSLSAKLTPRGDHIARRATDSFTLSDSRPLLLLIALLAGDGRQVSEENIIGKSYDDLPDSSDLAGLEHRALPLLAANLLESASESGGSVCYFLTDAACHSSEPSAADFPAAVYSQEAADTYDEIFKRTLAGRDHWEPFDVSAVVIPMSSGAWPPFVPIEPDSDRALLTRAAFLDPEAYAQLVG